MDISTVDHLLTTTRSVRKRLDFERPVEPEIIQECLDIALQAPTGRNAQGWKWLIVTDADKKARIGEYYRKSFEAYIGGRISGDKDSEQNNAEPGKQREIVHRVIDPGREPQPDQPWKANMYCLQVAAYPIE